MAEHPVEKIRRVTPVSITLRYEAMRGKPGTFCTDKLAAKMVLDLEGVENGLWKKVVSDGARELSTLVLQRLTEISAKNPEPKDPLEK